MKPRARRYLPMTLSDDYAVRDELYTRRGGMYYGVKQLLGYDSGYNQKIFRFADYQCRPLFQPQCRLSDIHQHTDETEAGADGDLLLYDKNGQALSTLSNTEKALRSLNGHEALGLSEAKSGTICTQEKTADFGTTQTYIAVKNAYFGNSPSPRPMPNCPALTSPAPSCRTR